MTITEHTNDELAAEIAERIRQRDGRVFGEDLVLKIAARCVDSITYLSEEEDRRPVDRIPSLAEPLMRGLARANRERARHYARVASRFDRLDGREKI